MSKEDRENRSLLDALSDDLVKVQEKNAAIIPKKDLSEIQNRVTQAKNVAQKDPSLNYILKKIEAPLKIRIEEQRIESREPENRFVKNQLSDNDKNLKTVYTLLANGQEPESIKKLTDNQDRYERAINRVIKDTQLQLQIPNLSNVDRSILNNEVTKAREALKIVANFLSYKADNVPPAARAMFKEHQNRQDSTKPEQEKSKVEEPTLTRGSSRG